MAAIEAVNNSTRSHLNPNIRRHFGDLQRLRRAYRHKRRNIISHLLRAYRLRLPKPPKPPPRSLASSALPVELLLDIFSLAIVADDAHESIHVHKSTSWVISHVCSRWRSIALAHPTLWSRLSIDTAFDAEWTDGKTSLLREVLVRSAAHPLYVVCTAGERCIVPSLLQPHTSQLVVLEISTHHNTDLTDLYRLSQMDLPLLEIFRIEVEITTRSMLPDSKLGSPRFDGIWFHYAPRLREIRLHTMSFHALLPWAQIRVFSGNLHGWRDFFILFDENHALEEAHITFLECDTIPSQQPTITVPSLRELSIAMISFVPFMAFAFPNLRMLRLAEPYRYDLDLSASVFDGDFFAESHFFRTFLSNTQLETLILDTYALSSSILLPVLRSCLPQLKVLYFSVKQETASEVYGALTLGKSTLVPNLRELYIHDVSDSSHFPLSGAFQAENLLVMIQSRMAKGLRELILCAPQSTKSVASRYIVSALEDLDGLELTVHWGYRWFLHKYGTIIY